MNDEDEVKYIIDINNRGLLPCHEICSYGKKF